MSASEKLRVLEDDQFREGRFPRFPGDEVLLAALSQIRALVEAAEDVEAAQREPWTDEYVAIVSTLAALEKALP